MPHGRAGDSDGAQHPTALPHRFPDRVPAATATTDVRRTLRVTWPEDDAAGTSLDVVEGEKHSAPVQAVALSESHNRSRQNEREALDCEGCLFGHSRSR